MKRVIPIMAAASSMLGREAEAVKASIIPDLEYYPIDMSAHVLRSIAEGFSLYKHIDKLTVCDYHTQALFSTMVDSASTFWGSGGETDLIREGVWLFTDALGLSSYAVRTCHRSYTSLKELNVHYWKSIGSFPQAASEAHDNVIKYETNLNAQGFSAFVGFFQGRYQDFAYGLTRAVYLAFMEKHFESYVPGTVDPDKEEKKQQKENQGDDDSQLLAQQLFSSAPSEGGEHPRVRGIWPMERTMFNDFHYALELIYEFIRGTRLVKKSVLDVCETRLTNFMLVWNDAQDYIEMGQMLEDPEAELEGIFRVFDSFLLLTDLGRGCWDTYWRVGNSMQKFVAKNVLSGERTLVNLMNEYFILANNISVFFADYFFKDWLSFAYYSGDTVYRLIVVQHEANFNFK